jgi:vancomycin permeability regulator SanA
MCFLCVFLLGLAGITVGYKTQPLANMPDGPYDVAIVLGSPTRSDGTLSEAQRARVDTAVAEYKAGHVPVLLFSGGPTLNQYPEARTMAMSSIQQGVPADRVFEEERSLDTLQNIQNSEAVMSAHGWTRAEVISSEAHLHRAGAILERTPLHWHTKACLDTEHGVVTWVSLSKEAFGTTAIRIFGLGIIPWMHKAWLHERGVFYPKR